jgi:hypothetical protein
MGMTIVWTEKEENMRADVMKQDEKPGKRDRKKRSI